MHIYLKFGLLLLTTTAPIASEAQSAATFTRTEQAMALTQPRDERWGGLRPDVGPRQSAVADPQLCTCSYFGSIRENPDFSRVCRPPILLK
jgi:hypothetical protein